MKDSTNVAELPALLRELVLLIYAHRGAFRQERTFLRAMGLLFGELFAFGRRTVTQILLALGCTDADWSPWYRLLSHDRFRVEELARCLFRETLVHVRPDEYYPVVLDGTQIPRSSQKMPGTSWLKAPRTPPFRVGIHRAQRFLNGAWLTPLEDGYTRAVPLRFLPAFPEKAVPAEAPPRREWAAGLDFLRWVRDELDEAGRPGQRVLVLGDGNFDVLEFWRGLPEKVVLAVRTARNRCLYRLPTPRGGRGRPPLYGERLPPPSAWLQSRRDWLRTTLRVRGRDLPLRYKVEGPVLREGLPERPLFLIIVGGQEWWVGKRRRRRRRREPALYLVSAIRQGDQWVLPMEVDELLGWLWQRWEVEVTHREMKSGLGVGEKQCWGRRSAIVSVQWSVWVYAVLVLAGYRAWGLRGGPPAPSRWWRGSGRWSLSTLWRSYRAALWGTGEFRALWTGTGDNWLKKEAWLAGLSNAVAAAARI
ncbi:MAG: transposase [Acetobacteraceae bacterium]|nr:transposase [Acetobacteraceae bacterium]